MVVIMLRFSPMRWVSLCGTQKVKQLVATRKIRKTIVTPNKLVVTTSDKRIRKIIVTSKKEKNLF